MIESHRGDMERDKMMKDGKKCKLIKLLNKMKELITIYKKFININKTIFVCIYKMNKINTIDLYCIKCLKLKNNSSNIKIKHEIDGINRLFLNIFKKLIHDLKNFTTTNEKEVNNLLKT